MQERYEEVEPLLRMLLAVNNEKNESVTHVWTALGSFCKSNRLVEGESAYLIAIEIAKELPDMQELLDDLELALQDNQELQLSS